MPDILQAIEAELDASNAALVAALPYLQAYGPLKEQADRLANIVKKATLLAETRAQFTEQMANLPPLK